MNKIAQFSKVSIECFAESMKTIGLTNSDIIRKFYDDLPLPTRATSGSAGYDFYAPFDFEISTTQITIPTGIRCKMDNDWVLMCYPRSGLGFKYGVRLSNTAGIIDSDYYYSDNSGHIMFRLTSDSPVTIKEGDRFVQGIFLTYGITTDDTVNASRNGGMGSSGA